jgi:tetratricopeptide (TPR) repeat protein
MRNLRLLVLAALLLGASALMLGWREGRRYEQGSAERNIVFASLRAREAPALTEEAIRLYAAGKFPRACEKFGLAAAGDPASAARRQDVVRCFEGWGWHALREGRPDEAALLFTRGLTETPDDPALLKGLGVAAVHAGRPDDAFAPLERAARVEYDPEVRLLLAHLHDRRDDPAQAVVNLKAVLEHEPANEPARRLLDKVEREWRAEAGFRREVTPHFVVKYRDTLHVDVRREIVTQLETAAARIGRELAYVPQQRTTVVLYEYREFRDVTRVHAWATGLFDGKIRLPVGRVRPPAHELERLVAHEYAHAAIHELARGRAPRWLHEGLAQVLEGASADPILRAPAGLTLAGVEALAGDSDPLRARAG